MSINEPSSPEASEIALLSADLERTRAQLKEALAFSSSLEGLHRENSTLKKQLLDSKAEVDDLKNRLEICLNRNSDLAQNGKTEPDYSSKMIEIQLQQLQSQKDQIKSDAEKEISVLRSSICELEAKFQRESREKSNAQTQISQIISLSSEYFSSNIQNIQTVISILSSPQVRPKSLDQTEIKSLEENVRQQKSKFKSVKSYCKSLELELNGQQSQFQSLALQLKEKDAQLEAMKQTHLVELQSLRIESQKSIAAVKDELKPLKKLASTEAQTEPQPSYELESAVKRAEKAESEAKEIRSTVKELIKKNSILSDQIIASDSERKKLKQKASKISNQLGQIMEEAEKKTVEEVKADDTQLKEVLARENAMKADIDDKNKQISLHKEAESELMNSLSGERKEIEELLIQRSALLTTLQQMSQFLGKIQTLPKPVQSSSQQIEASPQEASYLLDLSALPTDLVENILRISGLEAKVSEPWVGGMIKVIANWVQIKDDRASGELKELKKLMKSDKDSFENAKMDICNALRIDASSDPVSAIQRMNSDLEYLKQFKEEQLKIKAELFNRYKMSDSDDLSVYIQSLIEKNSILAGKVERKVASIKRKSDLLKDINCAYSSLKEASDNQAKEFDQKTRQSLEKINSLTKQIERLQKENKDISEELGKLQKGSINEYNDAQAKFEESLHKKDLEYGKLQIQIKKKAEEYTKSMAEMSQQIEDKENYICELGERIDKLLSDSDSLKSSLKESQKSLKDAQKMAQDSMAKLNEDHTKNLKDLTLKTDNVTAKMLEATNSLAEKTAVISDLRKQIGALEFTIKKNQMRANSLLDAAVASQKLAEAQLQSKFLAAESDASTKLDELRYENERKMKEMFISFAKNFGLSFDARLAIDENAFNKLTTRLKVEYLQLKKEENELRRIICAKNGQPIEEALVEYMIGSGTLTLKCRPVKI